MPANSACIDELKKKLRQLKKLEIKIRSSKEAKPPGLVWDTFFDLRGKSSDRAKYSLDILSEMDRETLKNVIDEFFFQVYYRFYRENGMTSIPVYDPATLAQLGLPPNADYSAIKRKFRELALKYHPDTGGDAEKFIELMDSYKKLTGG
jgi:hypothetical protein